jgi:hypothetical protein
MSAHSCLTPAERYRLSQIVEARTEATAAREIGCSPNTMARAMAGLRCYGATLAGIRAYIATVGIEEREAA